MKEMTQIFLMQELSFATRKSIIKKLSQALNNEMAMNYTSEIAAELIAALDEQCNSKK